MLRHVCRDLTGELTSQGNGVSALPRGLHLRAASRDSTLSIYAFLRRRMRRAFLLPSPIRSRRHYG